MVRAKSLHGDEPDHGDRTQPRLGFAQTSTPVPPYQSRNHMGICGMVNVFVANFPNRPPDQDANAALFPSRATLYLSPWDDRSATPAVISQTPCVAPDVETRGVGNIAQTCQTVDGGNFSAPCWTSIQPRPPATLCKCAASRPASAVRLGLG
jgi:hypothetical protein